MSEVEDLERLNKLRAQGVLSEAEFQSAKARLLKTDSGKGTPTKRSTSFRVVRGVLFVVAIAVLSQFAPRDPWKAVVDALDPWHHDMKEACLSYLRSDQLSSNYTREAVAKIDEGNDSACTCFARRWATQDALGSQENSTVYAFLNHDLSLRNREA